MALTGESFTDPEGRMNYSYRDYITAFRSALAAAADQALYLYDPTLTTPLTSTTELIVPDSDSFYTLVGGWIGTSTTGCTIQFGFDASGSLTACTPAFPLNSGFNPIPLPLSGFKFPKAKIPRVTLTTGTFNLLLFFLVRK